MYRQVLILPKYRKFQHILWRSSPHDKLLEYELNTVTYGINCAPYLAFRVLQSITSDDCIEFEWVRNALTRQTYVDDICDGADILKLQSDLICVLNKSGLELKKWPSNTPSVLDVVPAANRVHAPTPFETVDGQGTKVLGLKWHPDGDYLCCALSLEQSPVYSKRGILSLVAQIFDTLGVFGPVVFLAKSIMQRTWLYGLSWDEPLPPDIHEEWAAFVADLSSLLSIRVPCNFNSRRNVPCYLLGFCDASQRGYAAVVYLRMIDVPVGDSVFLVGTKTKLASTKSMSIPRLELNAALLLARWLNRIRGILAVQLNIVDIRAWSDSMIVLSWLKVPHESVKVYVSNRIAYDDPSAWDDPRPSLPPCELPELRLAACAALVADVPSEWFTRFSNYDRMLRVVAFMRRFVALCRRKISRRDGPVYIRKYDLDSAAQVLIVESQRVHFHSLLGADRQLRSLIHSAEGQAAIGNARATCDWHFNLPSAPHFDGLWEAAVRSTKRLLVRVIGNHIFTYEEFSTILVRVEAILNSRPLTPVSTDPHDHDCLTPGHFLIGQPLLAVPPRSDAVSVCDMSNRWKLLDQCHQAFWRRWPLGVLDYPLGKVQMDL
ncbi:hypothetical protein QTP88_004012 [Uroleucon formosanum]